MKLPDERRKNGIFSEELVEPPSVHFVTKPEDETVTEGSSVTMRCEASGTPPPIIHWHKDGRPIEQGQYEREDNSVEKLLNIGNTPY